MQASGIARAIIAAAGCAAIGATVYARRRRAARRQTEKRRSLLQTDEAESQIIWCLDETLPAVPQAPEGGFTTSLRKPALERAFSWTGDLAALAQAIENATPAPEHMTP